MPTISFPEDEQTQRKLLQLMLGLPRITRLSTEELILLCEKRGYIHTEKEVLK